MDPVFQVLVKKKFLFSGTANALIRRKHIHGERIRVTLKGRGPLFYLVKTTLTDYSEIMIWEFGVQMSKRYLG